MLVVMAALFADLLFSITICTHGTMQPWPPALPTLKLALCNTILLIVSSVLARGPAGVAPQLHFRAVTEHRQRSRV
jgi:heme/copper-type cytochrome/quinol oxidase subunit 3